ncbi:MAG: hypothetical protein ACT4OO_08980 [Nitrospiraceae bacterium]
MSSGDSLDQRYLEFTAKTSDVFARFPQIEPLRHFIFKDLLIQPRPLGVREAVKHWFAPLVRREQTTGVLQKGKILIWIESARDIMRDTLMPVFLELTKRGEHVRLVSFNGPGDLPGSTLRFRYPAACFAPHWARQAWDALCEADQQFGDRSLAQSFYYACANVQSLLDEMKRVLHAVTPHVVVTASTQLVGGSAMLVAARLSGIRSLLLQHGLLQPFHLPIVADVMCTWGQSSNDTLARLGIERNRVRALGSPRHDDMGPSTNGAARPALLQRLSLKDTFTLAFFSNGNDLLRNGRAPFECARWLEVIAKRFKSRVNVIVRLHPNEDGSLYRNCPHLVITKDRPELGLLLDGCDCVASLCSTALHEALLYHKPAWQLSADGWPDLAENWKHGLAKRISSESELSEMVEHVVNEGIQERPMNDMVDGVFINHGRATHAVADFVISQSH